MYKDISDNQNPVKRERDPSEDAEPGGEKSAHEGGADYDMHDASADEPVEGNAEPASSD